VVLGYWGLNSRPCTWATSPGHFNYLFPELASNFRSLLMAEMKSMWHYPALYWLRWGSVNFLPRLAWNCDPSDLRSIVVSFFLKLVLVAWFMDSLWLVLHIIYLSMDLSTYYIYVNVIILYILHTFMHTYIYYFRQYRAFELGPCACLLGRYSTTWAMIQSFCIIFGIQSHI
jgi:hypothetical protein